MSKITIEVANENLEIVLSILNNLKEGLLSNIEVDQSVTKQKTTYKPKMNKVIKEDEPQSGKYMNPANYKKRLQKKV